ncbi:MAG: late competence development ComFB family protein [Oscillospiraceae bacterium]
MYRNVMEIIVEQRLDEMLKNSNCCKCEKCREDMIAIVLNNIKTNYVSSDKGTLYAKAEMLSTENDFEVMKQIAYAMKIVSEKPHHQQI